MWADLKAMTSATDKPKGALLVAAANVAPPPAANGSGRDGGRHTSGSHGNRGERPTSTIDANNAYLMAILGVTSETPAETKRTAAAAIASIKAERHCVCQQPEDERLYILCDGCAGWFHPKCVGVPVAGAEHRADFTCPDCCSAATLEAADEDTGTTLRTSPRRPNAKSKSKPKPKPKPKPNQNLR
jgi:hypothetical protein